MDHLSYISKVSINLGIVNNEGNTDEIKYQCPICMRVFVENKLKDCLTKEHVPQYSLGGRVITLTCKECNSFCGSNIDVYLQESLKELEQRVFLPGTKRKVYVRNGEEHINAYLSVDFEEITLSVDSKHNNPKTWKFFHDNVLVENSIVDLQDAPGKHDKRRVAAAIIKNAYLILFSQTGFSILADPFYNMIRKQILEPEPFILPERLWSIENNIIPNGIYLTKDNRFRGFYIVFSVQSLQLFRFRVIIPTPQMDYQYLCSNLKENVGLFPVTRLPDYDFICDTTAISRLRQWCYGWGEF